MIPEKDENGLQGEGEGRDYGQHSGPPSPDKPQTVDGGVLWSLPLVTAYGHKDGPVVLGALHIVSHGAHKHGSGSNNPDSWGDAEGRKDGSRHGPNNGRDSGHYTKDLDV